MSAEADQYFRDLERRQRAFVRRAKATERMKKWRQANPERARGHRRKYEASAKGKANNRIRVNRYYQRHRDQQIERMRAYKRKNREALNAVRRAKYWADHEGTLKVLRIKYAARMRRAA